MRWPTVPFESLYAEASRNGVYKSSEHHGEGVKIVNMGELFAHDVLSNQEMSRLTMSEAEMLKSGLADGDLLFGRRSLVESGAGKSSIVEKLAEPTTFESSIIRVRLNPEIARPKFYFYWLRSHQGKAVIRAIVTGTNVKGIRGSDLKNIRVVHPSVDEQDSIVAVLRTYDELIENNHRRIQLLEQSARLLFKEWFVHLRFPGHEHATIVNGVPEGWERRTTFDVMEITSGGTPKTDNPDYWQGDIPFFTPKDTNNEIYVYETEKSITEQGLKNCNSQLYPKDTIFITARGTVGKLNIAQTAMAMNQSCYALTSKPFINQYFLYFSLLESVEKFRNHAVGAVFDAIIRDTFKVIPFTIPSNFLINTFAAYVDPVLRQIDNLVTQNRRLIQARDLFLPRLMNGEIVV